MERPAEIQPDELVNGLQAYLAQVAHTAREQRYASTMFGTASFSGNPLYRVDSEKLFTESIVSSVIQTERIRRTLGQHGLALAVHRQEPEDQHPELLKVATIGFDDTNYQFMAVVDPSEGQIPGLSGGGMLFSMQQPEYIPIVGGNLGYIEGPTQTT